MYIKNNLVYTDYANKKLMKYALEQFRIHIFYINILIQKTNHLPYFQFYPNFAPVISSKYINSSEKIMKNSTLERHIIINQIKTFFFS